MPTQLPHLPVSTRDFAIDTSHALNTVRRVPPSPPKQPPPRARRSDSSVAEEDVAARSVTPPVPVRSPMRNVDSPESLEGEGARRIAVEREVHTPSSAPEPRSSRTQPLLSQIPTSLAPLYFERAVQPPAQPIALQPLKQLPTSFYAPRLAQPACAAPEHRTAPPARRTPSQRKNWKSAWLNKTRIVLRVVVFLLLLIDMSMAITTWGIKRLSIDLILVTLVSMPPLP